MKLKVDKSADALYLRLDDSKIIDSKEVSPGVILDFNDKKQVVGVEILNLSQRTQKMNLGELQFQTVQEIIIPKKDPIRELAKTICQAAEDTKASDLLVLDLRKQTSFADYLIICSGTSNRQIEAIADNVRKLVRDKLNRRPLGIEGMANSSWVLLDYGDVVLHIFVSESRAFYRLEGLWHDAKRVKFRKSKSDE